MQQSSKAIVYENDGKVCVCYPVISSSDPVGFTEADAIDRALQNDIPKESAVHIVDRSEIPTDRTFRSALKTDLTHDIEKCRDIWKDKMRRERDPKLAELDIAYQRADEAGSAEAKQEVAQKKQALRDVTAHPDLAKAGTPEELKAVWPDILGAG